jgi:hypothetical protein
MTELNSNHLLCFVIIAMILYYTMGSCGCGFRVGGQSAPRDINPRNTKIKNAQILNREYQYRDRKEGRASRTATGFDGRLITIGETENEADDYYEECCTLKGLMGEWWNTGIRPPRCDVNISCP